MNSIFIVQKKLLVGCKLYSYIQNTGCYLLFFILFYHTSYAQTSSLVYLNSNGRLEYSTYANWGQTNSVNSIPDFSGSGYKKGGVKLPFVPVAEIINPITGDAREIIQSAINRVSNLPLDANGFRGAILLKSGKYEVNGSLYITSGGVVLRGEGQNTPDNGGTEIVATMKSQHDFIKFVGDEVTNSGSAEIILDSALYPAVDTWQEFDVLGKAIDEIEGDKTISLHITSMTNQYVSYSSREDILTRPYLQIKVKSIIPGVDSLIQIYPIADTYVRGDTYGSTNYGTDAILAVKNSGTNNINTREVYLKFTLPVINDSIRSAVLKLYTKKDLVGDPNAIRNVMIYVSYLGNDSWDEMQLTYNSRPASVSQLQSKRIINPYLPTGAFSLDVENVSGLSIGDTITVTRTPNDAWITALDMAQYGWTADAYRISYERIITAINNNTITINIPVVQAIENIYGGGEIEKISVSGRISNCGIENMLVSSYYAGNNDESHGWSAVTFSHTADCWAKNISARYFGYSCVGLYWAYNTTVEECAMLDPKSITTGSRKYSFYIDKGSFNLFQRCYTRGGRHDYVTGSRVAGPNVFLDCFSAETYADIGPHHRYATGILFDNIRGGETRVQNRRDMGTGHGWAGAQTLFWNCQSDVSEFKVESPLGAMNWGIGCKGLTKTGAGFWENWGIPVIPRSLYLQQIKDRLGESAIENITIPEQRAGNIWPLLIQWQGYGRLSVSADIGKNSENIPAEISLLQNYPNPFNPQTTIEYCVSKSGPLTLTITNSLGQEIVRLFDEFRQAGSYRYVLDTDNVQLTSGIYIYQLRSPELIISKKMIIIK